VPDKPPKMIGNGRSLLKGGVIWESSKPGNTSIDAPKEERGIHFAC